MAQDGPKLAPRWPQEAPKRHRDFMNFFSLPEFMKIWVARKAPREPQDGPRWPQDGAKMAQAGPKMTPRWLEMAPSWPQMAKVVVVMLGLKNTERLSMNLMTYDAASSDIHTSPIQWHARTQKHRKTFYEFNDG